MNAIDLWARLQTDEPYFIAEAGVNHLGSLELAERLIREAAGAGADAIKFQSYKADKLTTRDAPRFWDWGGEKAADGSQHDSYSQLDSFGADEHAVLARMCAKHGIEFMSTPFDDEAVDYLDATGMRAFKVASCDVTNHSLLRRIASKGKVVMLSTGAATVDEIRAAVDVLHTGTDMVVIMHCNLCYPTADADANLMMVRHLSDEFGKRYVYGLSDHTMNLLSHAVAYTQGARVFEKHFTVDKTLGTSADHWLSADPDDMRALIANVDTVRCLLGTSRTKTVTPSEERARLYARRSIVAVRPIAAHEKLTRDNITCKRPGTGIPASEFDDIVADYCFAKRELLPDEVLKSDDVFIRLCPRTESRWMLMYPCMNETREFLECNAACLHAEFDVGYNIHDTPWFDNQGLDGKTCYYWAQSVHNTMGACNWLELCKDAAKCAGMLARKIHDVFPERGRPIFGFEIISGQYCMSLTSCAEKHTHP